METTNYDTLTFSVEVKLSIHKQKESASDAKEWLTSKLNETLGEDSWEFSPTL